MATDSGKAKLPIWDEEQRQREQPKDKTLCAWPGCSQPSAEGTGTGAPRKYCEQAAEDDNTLPHNREVAKDAREVARKGPPQPPPTQTVSRALEQACEHLKEVLAALNEITDPEGIEIAVRTAYASAAYERSLREQAERRVEAAEQHVADCQQIAEEATAAAEKANAKAEEERERADAEAAKRQRAEIERDEACAREQDAANEITRLRAWAQTSGASLRGLLDATPDDNEVDAEPDATAEADEGKE